MKLPDIACAGTEPVDVSLIAAPDGIELLRAVLGTDPGRPSFGVMTVLFRYKDGTYRAKWVVRRPGRPGYMAHRMTEAELLVPVGKPWPHWTARPAGTGTKAFWMATPTKSLTGDDLAFRRLMLALKRYGVDHGLCAKLRKIERGRATEKT